MEIPYGGDLTGPFLKTSHQDLFIEGSIIFEVTKALSLLRCPKRLRDARSNDVFFTKIGKTLK